MPPIHVHGIHAHGNALKLRNQFAIGYSAFNRKPLTNKDLPSGGKLLA